jgi:hypothetical protein
MRRRTIILFGVALNEQGGIKVKRIISLFTMAALLAFSVFSLIGCILDNDASIAKRNLEQLISDIQNEDRDAIKALFSSNKLAEIDNFYESIDELLAYFEGDYVSHVGGGPATLGGKDGSFVYKYHLMSNDITTTVRVYHIALIWCVTDTADAGNVGIWSLYILDNEDAPIDASTISYWGDEDYVPGIHTPLSVSSGD